MPNSRALVVVSDFHISRTSKAAPDYFVAHDRWLDAISTFHSFGESTLVLNGDTFDLLTGAVVPADLHVTPALDRLRAILAACPEFVAGLRKHLDNNPGNDIAVLPGNHDPHLCRPDFIDVLREAVCPDNVADRKRIYLPESYLRDGYWRVDVGSAKFLIDHGDRSDDMNFIDYGNLGLEGVCKEYPSGTHFVLDGVNPFKKHGYVWIDSLQPQTLQAALVMFLVNPDVASEAVGPFLNMVAGGLSNAIQRKVTGANLGGTADPDSRESQYDIAIDELARDPDHPLTLADLSDLGRDIDSFLLTGGGKTLSGAGNAVTRSVRKFLQVSLRLFWLRYYAGVASEAKTLHERLDVHGRDSANAFERLVKYDLDGAIYGHTHLVRALTKPAGAKTLAYVNTGTWGRLLWPTSNLSYTSIENWLTILRENRKPDYDECLSFAVVRVDEKGKTALECHELGKGLLKKLPVGQ